MRIGYKSVRQHSDGRFFDDQMDFMKSPEDAVRRIVSAELLFGTKVEIKEDDDRPYREVTLSTSVLGTVDTTTLHFYKSCAPATAMFELTKAFADHQPMEVTGKLIGNRFDAAIWVEQFGSRAAILAAWLMKQRLIVLEETTQDDLVAMLELLIHGHTPSEINQLVG